MHKRIGSSAAAARPAAAPVAVSRVAMGVVLIVTLVAVSAAPARAFVASELVASGLDRPVYVTAPAGDARLFIVEQKGVIRLLKDGSVLPDPFLDISSIVKTPTAWSEQGLLGLAFHPGYSTNGWFFVHYSDLNGDTVIARYEVDGFDPDLADPSSARVVLTWDQPVSNHNGGSIEFGPDGYLYFGFGDGGGAGDPNGRAQNPLTLLGKFIRIDVDVLPYSVPPSNPFVGNPGVLDEIWAFGLRNPYRWSFDRLTGDLWIADVGQSLWEEIDFQPASSPGGENYGWNYMEGLHCYDPPVDCGADTLDLPIHEYDHDTGCSVTGGFVYRGADIPQLAGYYLFGDYCTNRIWGLEYDGSEVTGFLELTAHLNPTGEIGALSAIGQGGNGELYLVDRAGTTDGEVYRIVPDATGAGEEDAHGALLRLGPARPNPTASESVLVLTLARAGRVTVTVFDAAGRPVRTLLSGVRSGGEHSVTWDGRSASGQEVASGVYFVRADLDGVQDNRKLNLVR